MLTNEWKINNVFGGTYTVANVPDPYKITKVIFNPPATIVIWEDKTKTVVKCMDDTVFDPDVGLAMCISKKVLGDKFKSTFRKYVNEYNAAQIQEKLDAVNFDWNVVRDSMVDVLKSINEKVNKIDTE